MNLSTWIAIGVIVLIAAASAGYLYKAKKSGKKCIGCPEGSCSCCCGCDKEK